MLFLRLGQFLSKKQKILDGVLIANEIGEKFKVDFEKTYDSVDLRYYEVVMIKMNFLTL